MDELTHGHIFGMPTWVVLLTLGGAGVVGYLIFFRGASASTGSSSTGSSTYSAQGLAVMQNPDESATMAAQNQELYSIANYLAGSLPNLQTGLDTVSNQVADVSGQVSGVSGQVSDVGTQVSGVASGVSGLQSAVGADTTANQAYYQSLLNSLTAYANSILSGVTNANAAAQGAYSYSAADYATAQQTQSQQASDYANLYQYLVNMQQGLGGSTGTAKAEVLALAQALGQGGAVQNTLNSRGDGTTS